MKIFMNSHDHKAGIMNFFKKIVPEKILMIFGIINFEKVTFYIFENCQNHEPNCPFTVFL